MQIITIHKLQHTLDNSKKVIKFIWRHAFVLGSLAITVQGIYEGKTPILGGEALAFSIAFFLDWIKTKIKFSGGTYNHAHEQMFESSRRNMDSSRFGSSAWAMNPTQMGSPAWNMDPFAPGSSAYYTRNQTNY